MLNMSESNLNNPKGRKASRHDADYQRNVSKSKRNKVILDSLFFN